MILENGFDVDVSLLDNVGSSAANSTKQAKFFIKAYKNNPNLVK